MKIKYLLALLLGLNTLISPIYAVEHESQSREIIGSGFFDVNKTRNFVIDENSMIYLDQEPIDLEILEIIGSGFKSTFTLNNDVNATVDSGTINAIELITNLKGPITSLDPLTVLEQPVLITSDTNIEYPSSLNLGQELTISGYLSSNNSLMATKVMLHNQEWKIRGFAAQVNDNDFRIGNLHINRSAENIIDCDSGFNNGSLVEVKMAADKNYIAGSPIETITSIRCLLRNRLSEEKIVLPSVLQGFISATQGQDFWLDDIRVNVNNATEYINGEKSFINEAINIEVQGMFDSVTSEINADSIRFLDTRIEVTFPIKPNDIELNKSITVMNTIFYQTPQTKDNANILSEGLKDERQIQMQGYIDSHGQAYITKTLNKGAPNLSNVSLRGEISNIKNPDFNILNFIIDASDSTIVGLGSGMIDVKTFFDEVNENTQVDIINANFDNISGKLTGGIITIRKTIDSEETTLSREIIGSGFFGAFGTATITAVADQLFLSGFE
ncbi:MAG: DUF5666 domain-containing protein [Marinicellaceae bacterium]